MRKIYAHEQVVAVAKEMAHELYAEMMKDNRVYADWKSQCSELTPEKAESAFVEMLYPKLLEPARHTLATMLGEARYAHLHEGLYMTLCQDYILRQGRVAPTGRGRLHVEPDGTVRDLRELSPRTTRH